MSILAEYLAVLLLENANSDHDEEYGGSIATIRKLFEQEIGISLKDGDVERALLILKPFSAAEQEYSPLTNGFWHIKFDNFRYYFQQIDPDDGDDAAEYEKIREQAVQSKVLMAYARRGRAYAKDAEAALQNLTNEQIEQFRGESPPIGHIPASDRLVRIDHNSAEYADLIEVAKAADEAVRGSNGIDELSRGWIRDHIAAGLELIKKRKVLATAASALLLQPLIKAYEAVTEEPAKSAILAAIGAIKAFFGIA